MTVRIGTNVASLSAARGLSAADRDASRSIERLGSGLRINRASDDAAGLAVAASLSLDSRVYTQGVRNLNDGLSMLSVAQGTLEQLSTIVTRQKELAVQAANGVYGPAQRASLHSEADALTREFNRLVASTSFNSIALYGNGRLSLGLQGGYGSDGVLSTLLGGSLARRTGRGTMATSNVASAYQVSPNVTLDVESGDINGDGKRDLALISGDGSSINVMLGNGDGTFRAEVSYAIGVSATSSTHLQLRDLDGDGRSDIVFKHLSGGGGVYVVMANANGSLRAAQSFAAQNTQGSVQIGDMDGDGILDLVTTDGSANSISVYLGNGNGSFLARTSTATTASLSSLALGDIDDDGRLDVVSSSSNSVWVYRGGQRGALAFVRSQAVGGTAGAGTVVLADTNRDGRLDVFVTQGSGGGSTARILLGNADGSFSAGQTLATNFFSAATTGFADFNNDGIADLLVAPISAAGSGFSHRMFIGNGDGTFRLGGVFSLGEFAGDRVTIGDFTGDGVVEFIANDDNSGTFRFDQNIDHLAHLEFLNLNRQSFARETLELLDGTLDRISQEQGLIGAAMSRIMTGARKLQVDRDETLGARSRIEDVDVAEESSALLSGSIRKQVAASILASANQQPLIALNLVRNA